MKLDLSDKHLFGNDAGEDEVQEVLDSYFIDIEEFDEFYNENAPLCVVSARKGMGKSALLSRLEFKLRNSKSYENPIIVRSTGNALLGLGDFQGKDHAYLENYWKQIICKKINIEIGKLIGFALADNEISMVEAAELEGIKSRNLVGALISRIKGKIPGLNLELKKDIPDNWEQLLKSYQDTHTKSVIWVLIDDIDAKYLDTEEYQVRVGSFFSAIRGLVFDVKNLNIRATVRTDVWHNLRYLEDLDKWEQYLIEINWTKNRMKEMLAKRISSYICRKHPTVEQATWDYSKKHDELFELVFLPTIPWGKGAKPPFEPVNTLSNRRPRWMGQLCRMAAKQAHKSNCKIGINQIKEILSDFGKNRKNDLLKEHHHQFSDLDKLIDSLRAGQREYHYTQLSDVLCKKYVFKVGAGNIPLIDGANYSSPKQLGAFLYKIGLISKSHGDGSTFTHYSDDPDLYDTNINYANHIIWAVHPSYRSYLNIR